MNGFNELDVPTKHWYLWDLQLIQNSHSQVFYQTSLRLRTSFTKVTKMNDLTQVLLSPKSKKRARDRRYREKRKNLPVEELEELKLKRRNTRFKSDEDNFSKGRQRNFNSHKRQQTLRDLFNCEYDVTNLEIGQASEATKEPKRRLTSKNRPAPKRRLTPNKRDEI